MTVVVLSMGLDVWVLSHTFVFDVSNVARVGIGSSIGENLCAAIRKDNAVLSRSGSTVSLLILSKVSARVVIGNSVVVSIDRGCVRIGHHWSWMVGCWDVGSGGQGQVAESKENLHFGGQSCYSC